MATRELFFEKVCNAPKLYGEVFAAIGAKLDGVRNAHPVGRGEGVAVDVFDTATPADEATVTTLVTAHDPAPLPDTVKIAVQDAIASDDGGNVALATLQAEILAINDLAGVKLYLWKLTKRLYKHEQVLKYVVRETGIKINGGL